MSSTRSAGQGGSDSESSRYEKSLGSIAPLGALVSAGLLARRLASRSATGTPSSSKTEGLDDGVFGGSVFQDASMMGQCVMA